MLGEQQAVGARDLELLVLQRADDRLEQRPALAHQDEHVAVARGAAVDADRRAIVDSLRTARAIRCASFTRGLVSLTVSNGASQPSMSLLLVRLHRLPDFDHARRCVRQGDVRSGPASAVTLAAISFALNTSSTAPSTSAPERNECSNLRNENRNPASCVRASK